MSNKPKTCNRIYGQGAYTAKIINGVACCPSCELPTIEHRSKA